MLVLKFLITAILIVCATVAVCVYLKATERKELVFENSGYEKRISKLESEVEKLKKDGGRVVG